MGLFSKLKDYNLELEEVLDSKYFSGNIKSLLLNMIYKIEISYNDYSTVKRCVRSKEDFLNEFVEIIRLYCDNVKIVEPDSDQAKLLIKNKMRALTNEKERSILTYPTEIDLLYALSDISPKYFYIDSNIPIKNIIQNSLVNGFNMSNVEILKDFNGWSWDSKYDSNFNFVDNIVYTNLLMILGERFLYEWRTYGSTRKDFLGQAKKYISSFTNSDSYYKYLLKTLYYFSEGKEKEEAESFLKENTKLLKKMEDKVSFLTEVRNRKLKLTKKIEKLDLALNDKKALIKELEKTNSKLDDSKKIKSLKKYREMILKQRQNILKELEDITYLLKPTNFVERKHELKENLAFLECKEKDTDLLIAFQKEFLVFLEKKLSKMKTRDEVVNMIYILRYYSRLHLTSDLAITEIEELSDKIDLILKKSITMLCKLGAVKIISMDINLNYEIIRYALDTKIINLEETKIAIVKEKNDSIIIKVFDKDVFEKQGRKKIEVSKKLFNIKENRRIKLFN